MSDEALAHPVNAGMANVWRGGVSLDMRNHLVFKVVQAIFPTPDPATMSDQRLQSVVTYARRVEGDSYESAGSRAEYYHCLAERIYRIQQRLQEKRRAAQLQRPDAGERMQQEEDDHHHHHRQELVAHNNLNQLLSTLEDDLQDLTLEDREAA